MRMFQLGVCCTFLSIWTLSILGNCGVYVQAKTQAAIMVYVDDMLLLSSPRDTDALWRELEKKVDYKDPAMPLR